MRKRYAIDAFAAVAAVTWAILGCQSQANRESQVRNVIKQNLHFDLHCRCEAVTNATVPGILKEISEKDIPVLISLLGDKDIGVYVGAKAVLEKFSDAAIPALTVTAKAGDPELRGRAAETIDMIKFNKAHGISR